MFLSRIRVCQYVSDICFCDELLQHEFICNTNDGTSAGIKHEATEKLYERHYLVIKIVSSFFGNYSGTPDLTINIRKREAFATLI